MSEEWFDREIVADRAETMELSPGAPAVVVPLDGTESALTALPVAKAMSELLDAVLHVVHVGGRVLPPRELLRLLGLTTEQVRGSVIDEVVDEPAAGIVRVACDRNCQQIVMCTNTGTVETGHALGPVAERVLGTSTCPVLLVRPERALVSWEIDRVLLPHDGTPTTAAAIGPAVALASRAGAALIVLHVAIPGRARRTVEPGTMTAPQYIDQPQHEWPAWADEFLTRLRLLGHLPPQLGLRMLLAKGEPGEETVAFAIRCQVDLIVVAWHGDLSPEHAATMKTIIRRTPCPVLVVPFVNSHSRARARSGGCA
ncbi:MAG: universal stress protein [Pseudomonadota bacterium]